MPANVETMVSGRNNTPWHKQGVVVQGLLTAEECLTLSGLDWEVEKEPVYTKKSDGKFHEIPGRYANVRQTDRKVLGVVGGDYVICQNRDGFAFLNHLVDSGEAAFDTAGSLFGGKRVWISMLLPSTQSVTGDEYETWLMFSNTHDGSRGITCAIVKTRVVCSNTEQMALSGALSTWSIHHRQTMEGQLQAAREQLNLATKYDPVFEAAAEAMIKKQVTDDAFREILLDVFPEQKNQQEKNVEAVLLNRKNSTTIADDVKPTAWGAFHATTEWVDHLRSYRTEEARMKNVLLGQGAGFRNAIGKRLLELAR